MRKIIYSCIVLLGNSWQVFSQLNESDTAKFQIRFSITGNYQAGNVELLNIRGKGDLVFSPRKYWVFKSQNSSLYQAFYSKKADNDIFSRNYLYYKPSGRFYPFAIAYVSSNFRRKIVNRYFAGVGITWQAIRTQNQVLKFSASTVYEATRFSAVTYNYPEYDGDDRIQLVRGTLYVGGWMYLLGRRIRVYYDSYWQPAFENGHNYRTQVDIGADFPIWKGLAFNALFGYTHENVLIRGVQKDDKILTFGFSYNFKRL